MDSVPKQTTSNQIHPKQFNFSIHKQKDYFSISPTIPLTITFWSACPLSEEEFKPSKTTKTKFMKC